MVGLKYAYGQGKIRSRSGHSTLTVRFWWSVHTECCWSTLSAVHFHRIPTAQWSICPILPRASTFHTGIYRAFPFETIHESHFPLFLPSCCGIDRIPYDASVFQNQFWQSCCGHIRAWYKRGCYFDHFRTLCAILKHAVHSLRHHPRLCTSHFTAKIYGRYKFALQIRI
jgi:hypothetical protein